MLLEIEKKIAAIDKEILSLEGKSETAARTLKLQQLRKDREEYLKLCINLTPSEKVYLARHPKRPKITDYIDALFSDFFELEGDRLFAEDKSILGGIALYKGMPVTVIGHRKGSTVQENVECRFGMPNPEGYRKALRLMKQAEKFHRPIITFIDTSGAYPGIDAEARGQSFAISQNLAEMINLKVPVIAIVTGEGGSGGALALGVADRVFMLEQAIYSILSPEGFATILWKDAKRSDEAAEIMKLTAEDLHEFGIIDDVIEEPAGGAHLNYQATFENIDKYIYSSIEELLKLDENTLLSSRYEKFRNIGKLN